MSCQVGGPGNLSHERWHDVVEFEHLDIRYRAGIGRFSDGSLAEVFLDGGKEGTAINVQARDMAVVTSLALHYACPEETLRHGLTKFANGRGAGPLRKLLGVLAGEEPVDAA